ncbi:MAG TPA: hypothetical protein VHF46_03345 [Rubrobacteraceae bacterium]|nr:hypothetical protein [Rubrobacteraceae bacterium]
MVWEWQVWRCFDNIRETFEEKGCKPEVIGHEDSGARPVIAEFGDYSISFFKRSPYTGECWFELRDKARCRMVLVHREQNIPTPERAVRLLTDRGSPSEVTAPHERPIDSLPLALVAEAG